MECPNCGSEMWDNRENKRNPKQPDYKCKDKSCGHAIWLKPKPQIKKQTPTNEPEIIRMLLDILRKQDELKNLLDLALNQKIFSITKKKEETPKPQEEPF